MKKVFPGSEIGQKLRSVWKKTEAIISGVISSHAIETVKAYMANIPFCVVVTDASSLLALNVFPVFVQYFD
jgi:hypothetical protein